MSYPLHHSINPESRYMNDNAQVYLVGAGPGCVSQLTLAAVRALKQSDVLLLDDLVNPDILQFAQAGARIIPVGKRGGCPSTSQQFIQQEMISLARQGYVVGRIKSGDPFMFGRGGEELQALQAAGLSVAVINGISAGVAAPASLGISLTQRGVSQGVIFVTGHTQDNTAPNWQALADSRMTLVVYMGVSNLATITSGLLRAGLAPDTPAVAVQHASLPQQKQVFSTLQGLPAEVRAGGLASPAVLIIGNVAAHPARMREASHVSFDWMQLMEETI